MTLRRLRPNPPACLPISPVDMERLQSQHANLWRTPTKGCLTCNDQRTFRAREGGQIVEYECDCTSQWLLHYWLLNAGIALGYQRLAASDVVTVAPQARDQVLDYAADLESMIRYGRGLILLSPDRGTGKTMIAALTLKRALASGHDGYLTTFNQLLDRYQRTWRDDDEQRWFARRVRNATLLVIDDVGRENSGRRGVAEGMFDDIIRARVADQRPTIITTNYTAEQIQQDYSANAMSLLTECSTFVRMDGPDYRLIMNERIAQDVLDGVVRPLVIE